MSQHESMRKQEITVSQLLGLRQQEAAQLLGVTRSQIAMFESGKRSLPVLALQLLAELLKKVQEHPQAAKGIAQNGERLAERQQQLRQLQDENHYQQVHIGRKIASATKKYEAQCNMQVLVGLADKHPGLERVKGLFARNTKSTGRLLTILTQLEIKLELLRHEQKWIEKQLS